VTPQAAAAEWSDLAKESAARAANEEAPPPTRAQLVRECDLAEAAMCDAREQIALMDGLPIAAAYHWAFARSLRTRDPKDEERRSTLYVSMAAEEVLKRGVSVDVYAYRAKEIRAEVERMRADCQRAAEIVAAMGRVAP
jgi:hypothetical protein